MTPLDAHLARCRLAGQRPATIRTKRVVLRSFANNIGGDLLGATKSDCEQFIGSPATSASRQAYRSHLRAFYGWALEEGLIDIDPTARIPSVRRSKGVPRPVAAADLARAIQHAPARMRAWLLLMSMAGLRCVEVAALRPEDVITTSDGRSLLYLREVKGGGTATVPAHPAVLEALAVLPVYDGGLWWSVKPDTVSVLTSSHLRSLGIEATAHQLRHYAGTAWYEASGYDLLATARLMRHTNVATTQVYAQLDTSRPAAIVERVQVPIA